MAALNPQKSLQDEASCPICLDYFQTPMMIIDCGHNFCQDCITKCGGPFLNTLCCPQCRMSFPKENLRPNRHLWNIVEVAKQFSLQRANETKEQKLCQKHKEPLKLFCEQDQTSICVVCDRSKVHKNHSVVPVEEAAQVYQVKIQSSVQALKKERDEILSLKLDAEKPNQDLLLEVKAEREALVLEFQQLRQFLEKEEQFSLSHLANLEEKIEKKKEEHTAPFSEEISNIAVLIGELEQKCQEPPSTMLQDIGSILNRCKRKKIQCPAQPDSSELKKILQEFSRTSASLQQVLRKFRESLVDPKWIKENVTLDPVTAHPRFILSEDQKIVCWNSVRQDLPYDQRRFDPSRCVLGSQGFSSGKHYWAVNVAKGTSWAVGVAKESVKRKGPLTIGPEEGIWAIGFWNGQYRSLQSPPVILDLEKNVRRIQIYLDYEKRTLSFWDADNRVRFAFFTSLKFQSEEVFPFFRVGDRKTVLHLY